jgi:hypothetical protein
MADWCTRGSGYGDRIADDYYHDRCPECGARVRVEVSLGQRFLTQHYEGRDKP